MKILSSERHRDEAECLAAHIGGEACFGAEQVADGEKYLRLDEDGLTLVSGKMELRGDFSQSLQRVIGGHIQHEKLLRAARIRGGECHPLAIDATAGLGEDSFILAAGGCRVIMCEYNPIIAALLCDSLRRAKDDVRTGEIAERMEICEGNCIETLGSLSERPDIIYLDPMFPAKQKSGISTKKLQLLQGLELPCANEEELMDAAVSAHPGKIIVKRPVKGNPLANRKPGYAIECRNVRYDCYVLSGGEA